MTRTRQSTGLVLIFLVAAGSSDAFAEEPFFRFLDDFSKCGCPQLQRDPYEERIETERHDFTQSTVTVGRGVFQIESGYTFFYKDHEEEIEQSHSFPEMLLRYGVSEDVEIRMRTDYIWRFVDVEDNVDGAEDLQFGVKLGMTEQECLIPESALEIAMTVPTGGSAWNTGRVNVGLDFIYGWEINEDVTIYGSTGAFQNALGDFGFLPEEPAGDRFVAMSQSAAVGLDLTDRSTMYVEYFGIFTKNLEDDVTVGIFNIGIDYYVTDNFVLDVRSGVGLTEDSDDLFVGVGGGYRF